MKMRIEHDIYHFKLNSIHNAGRTPSKFPLGGHGFRHKGGKRCHPEIRMYSVLSPSVTQRGSCTPSLLSAFCNFAGHTLPSSLVILPRASTTAMETPNSYEERRRQRVEANKKVLMGLGLHQLKENLVQTLASEPKSKKREVKSPKPKQEGPVERRSSARVSRLPVPIYREVDDFPRSRKSRTSHDSKRLLRSYASDEARMQAQENAETRMKDLGSEHPYFVKSLVRSHVSSCFWLGLPKGFCVKYLPKNDVSMVLEDEKGDEFDTVYIAKRTGLSGGWRGFALDHDLDDGDAIVFELVEPRKFKVHVTKAKDFESGTGSKKAASINGNLPEESGAARKLVVKKTSNVKSVKENSPREQKVIKKCSEQDLTSGKVTSTILNPKKGNASKKAPASQTKVRTITISQATDNVNNDQSTRLNKRGREK